MAASPFQRDILRLLAERRRAGGESYVAGGVALSVLLQTQRVSRDLDLFHDTTEAVAASWEGDRRVLVGKGLDVAVLHDRPGYVQATVSRPGEQVLIEWVRDSAFRFFPLIEHPELGLALHPFDLATNKVLALVGRLEVRDWIDVLACDARVQPLGYLAWAASGKDPGFTPSGILAHARRSARYSAAEIASLAFDGPPPDPAALAREWRHAADRADEVVAGLPAEHAGEAVLSVDGDLFCADPTALARALTDGRVRFHPGRIGGALPRVVL
jgi:hypothetical protein